MGGLQPPISSSFHVYGKSHFTPSTVNRKLFCVMSQIRYISDISKALKIGWIHLLFDLRGLEKGC